MSSFSDEFNEFTCPSCRQYSEPFRAVSGSVIHFLQYHCDNCQRYIIPFSLARQIMEDETGTLSKRLHAKINRYNADPMFSKKTCYIPFVDTL